MVFKKIIFQNSLMANETPSRPPPPFMANAILNFHFDYRHPSLTHLHVQEKSENGFLKITVFVSRIYPTKTCQWGDILPQILDCEPQYNFVTIKQVTVIERPCPAFFVRRSQVWHFLDRHLAALFTCCSSSLLHLSLSFFYSIFAFLHNQMKRSTVFLKYH